MIVMCRHSELLSRLAQYPTPGLFLSPYFHGVVETIPSSAMARPSETLDGDGLGLMDAWSGFVDTVPFALRGQAVAAGWGFEIALPVLIRDGRLAPELLDVLSRFPGEITKCDRPYWETLPFRGAGYGVLPHDGDVPIFRSPVKEDATLAAEFANAKQPSAYHVALIEPDERLWTVAGPIIGQYISRVEVTTSESSAQRIAAKWMAESDARFEVRCGAISD
jgi:hypothetical protein